MSQNYEFWYFRLSLSFLQMLLPICWVPRFEWYFHLSINFSNFWDPVTLWNVLPWSKQTQKTRVKPNMASETLEREANFVYHFQGWCIILLSFFYSLFGVVPFLLSFKILRITSWGTKILTLVYFLEDFFLIFMYISI